LEKAAMSEEKNSAKMSQPGNKADENKELREPKHRR
jgi:hypothetical protein